MRQFFILLLFGIALLGSGCAVTLNMPAIRFDSPESQGSLGKGYVGIGASKGKELTIIPNTTINPVTESRTFDQGSSLPVSLGLGLVNGLDLELRGAGALGGSSPNLLRAKYQFIGAPRQTAKEGNFSLAGVAGAGWVNINDQVSTNSLSDISATTSGKFSAADVGVLAGYRFKDWNLWYSGVFYTAHSFSGTVTQTGTGASASPYSFSGSATQSGVNVGTRFEFGFLALQLEAAYASAKADTASSSEFAHGLMLAIHW